MELKLRDLNYFGLFLPHGATSVQCGDPLVSQMRVHQHYSFARVSAVDTKSHYGTAAICMLCVRVCVCVCVCVCVYVFVRARQLRIPAINSSLMRNNPLFLYYVVCF